MDGSLYYQYQVYRRQLSKLQAHKSSFQAWKCVSFGYALLAAVLLSAKWHEVSTDLGLLNGIDQLLWQTPGAANASAAQPAGPNRTDPAEGHWGPAAALVELLAASGPPAGGEPANGSAAVLVSHMQISLGRELSGNQILKQEVETFLAEFRSAKSTLGLSSLLVFVYIISWVLMTMAVNDTRISNDISLRNILLLSVFGAIDMVASVGFVMVRMIMFNVKSGTVMPDMLGSATLRDAPVRLSADQLTAFTALRLIAMRSCSAHVDVYVSVLVALLTLLRFYAIVRAIAYYRFLRRFHDLSRNLHHHHQLAAAVLSQTSDKQPLALGYGHAPGSSALQGFVSQGGAGAELMQAPTGVWRAPHDPHATAGAAPTLTSATNGHGQPDTKRPVQNRHARAEHAQEPLKSSTSRLFGEAQQQPVLTSYTSHQDQVSSEKLDGTNESLASQIENHHFQIVDAAAAQAAANIIGPAEGPQAAAVTNKTLIKVASYAGQHHTVASRQTTDQRQPLFVISNDTRRTSFQMNNPLAGWPAADPKAGDAPAMLMFNGQPHRLVSAAGTRLARRRLLGHESTGFESEPVTVRAAEREYLTRSKPQASQLHLAADQLPASQVPPERGGHGARQQPASFTLLSSSQLDRLSRKLLANATGSLALGPRAGPGRSVRQPAGSLADPLLHPDGRYRLLARYRPLKKPASHRDVDEGLAARAYEVAAAQRAHAGTLEDTSSASSSSTTVGTDSDEALTARVATTPEAGPRLASIGRRARRRELANQLLLNAGAKASAGGGRRRRSRDSPDRLRQTEELSLEPSATTNANRDLLLGKYYYA